MRGEAAALVRTRFRIPLYRNGYALVASSGVTSVLGLAYWLVAARSYSPESVGIGAALIAAMTLLANLAQLNLKGALNRFLPTAGEDSARLVTRSYAAALALSAAASCVFIAGLGLWSPKLGFLAQRPELALWFVAATMAWTVFVLQDSVLAGIRQAAWVPAENLAFSIAKLVLLVALTGAAPLLGAFVSWSIPAVALVIPISLLLFRRLIPRHVRATRGRQRPVSLRGLAGYMAADSVAYAIWAATIGLLPLAVLHVSGAEANAHFFVAWAIAYSLYLVSSGMAQSLLAEGALDPERLAEHRRRTTAETTGLVAVGAVALVAFAPNILGLLGEGYADDATTLLRLLALSAIPYVAVAVRVNVARIERRMRTVVATYAALCGLVLGIGLPLLLTIGIAGLGVAWLVAQSVVAVGPAVHAAWLSRALRPVLDALGARGRTEWAISRLLPTQGEVTVAVAGPADGGPAAILKRARGDQASAALARGVRAMLAVRSQPGLGHFRGLIPRPIATGTVRGRAFVAEAALAGTPGDRALKDGLAEESLLAETEGAMRPLYRTTATSTVVDDRLLSEWVGKPLAVLRASLRAGSEPALGRLETELGAALLGRRVETSFVHGDLWAGNLLFDERGRVSGIVDWEGARAQGLARVDLLHLLVTSRAQASKREIGDVVAELLDGPFRAEPPGGGRVGDRTLLLLAWLHHVAGNLSKARWYGRSGRWIRRNVEPVLGTVARSGELWAPAGAIAAGLALCIGAMGAIDVREMSDLGLVSVLPPAFFAGLVAITASFARLVHLRPDRPAALAGALIALVTMLHATPAIVYDTLRYSWSWKHAGIVDYIERHRAVSPDIETLAVYHNWPGFFGVDALLTDLAGLGDAVGQAMWGPLFFNLLCFAALLFLFSGLTRDRRVVWVGCWLFFAASWVGQDYFAPQAFAFFLYLVLVGVVVRWLGDRVRAWALVLAVALITAIAISHPLTAVMTVVALTAIVLARASPVRALPLIALAITAGWNLTFASPYVTRSTGSVLDSIRLPWATTENSLAASGTLSDGQALVATAGRGLAAAIVALAALGAYRLHRAGRVNRAAAALALAPLALFAAGDYGGEVLFRIYLFALPFFAFLGAHAFAGTRSARSALAFAAVATVMLGALLVAYYGKERQYHFTPAEVAASRYVYQHAPPGSLLIEGSRNYPAQFKNYERFEYVPLSREPSSSHARFVARPVDVMSEWMSDPRHPAAYLIITRSQKAEVEELGVMPPGSLDTIERALLRSPRFTTLVHDRDATVFTLAGGRQR